MVKTAAVAQQMGKDVVVACVSLRLIQMWLLCPQRIDSVAVMPSW